MVWKASCKAQCRGYLICLLQDVQAFVYSSVTLAARVHSPLLGVRVLDVRCHRSTSFWPWKSTAQPPRTKPPHPTFLVADRGTKPPVGASWFPVVLVVLAHETRGPSDAERDRTVLAAPPNGTGGVWVSVDWARRSRKDKRRSGDPGGMEEFCGDAAVTRRRCSMCRLHSKRPKWRETGRS